VITYNAMTTTPSTRMRAAERREAVLDAATKEFAAKGLHGASTDDIARAAGISQPYLFRLFRTKKDLYLATVERSIAELYEVFAEAGRGRTGMDALQAMGSAYRDLMTQDRVRMLLMLKCWGTSDDAEIRERNRSAWRALTELAEEISGESPEVVGDFFASGTLLTVFMAMDLFDEPEPWADRLIAGRDKRLGR